ncbi:MAG TPA: NAD(P)-binding domain-containing protein, partial [Thermomicrobiales bacterium]|nr:NAD(P)-binding domain-containing protein [Thermomicrobiales bacterium]
MDDGPGPGGIIGRLSKVISRRSALGAAVAIALAEAADLVFLTVKPQVLAAIMKQLHGRLEPRQVAVSVVAGASV